MSLDEIGFDRFQRFRFTAELIASLGEESGGRVLDVGSFDNTLGAFLPEHEVTAYDREISSGGHALDMADDSIDVVVALDVLEHVAPAEREFFLGELARVATGALVIGFPIAAAAAAESMVLELTGSPWLAQHKEHGLPEPREVEAVFERLGLTHTRHPNACLPSWTAMMLLMYGVSDKGLRAKISSFFNRNYYELENREPAYRYIYLCRPQGS